MILSASCDADQILKIISPLDFSKSSHCVSLRARTYCHHVDVLEGSVYAGPTISERPLVYEKLRVVLLHRGGSTLQYLSAFLVRPIVKNVTEIIGPKRLTESIRYRLDIGSRVPLTSDQLRGEEVVRHGLCIRRRSDLSDRF